MPPAAWQPSAAQPFLTARSPPGASGPSLPGSAFFGGLRMRQVPISEHFPFETLYVPNHMGWRFSEKARFFRLFLAGRRSAAASRFSFSKVKRSKSLKKFSAGEIAGRQRLWHASASSRERSSALLGAVPGAVLGASRSGAARGAALPPSHLPFPPQNVFYGCTRRKQYGIIHHQSAPPCISPDGNSGTGRRQPPHECLTPC